MEPTDPLLYSELIGFIISLSCCALFSFLETTITALRLFKLKEIASSAPRYQEFFKTLEERPNQVLVTILIANNIANVTAAALSTNIMEKIFRQLHFSGSLGFSLGIAVATILLLIFGEVIPKNIAKVHGEKLFRSTLWLTNIIYYVLYPFVILLIKFSSMLIRLVSTTEASESVVSEHEIKFMIDYIDEKGLMEKEKSGMLQSIFRLGSKQTKEIMVPAIDIVMLNINSTIKESFDVFCKYQFSRLPVYRGTKDNIIGLVIQKDIFVLMSKHQEKSLEEILRPIFFVPESLKINQLLREFRQKGIHIAIVINELGSITGLVTLEDILEEIVGEIRDEYEAMPEKITPLKEGEWLADGSVDLESLERVLDIQFETATAVTLGGFLTEHVQHLPKTGERISYKGYYFHIQQANQKRVLQVKIIKQKSPSTPKESKS